MDDVVGDDGVTRAHYGHCPTGPQRVDGVPCAVDQQRGAVAVDRLLETLAGDVGITVFGVPGRRAGGEGERDGDRAGRQASAGDRPFHRGLLSP